MTCDLWHESIIKTTVLEVVLLLDVLQHTTLLQPCPVDYRLTKVLSQTHFLEPLHKVTTKETLHHSPLPTSPLMDNVTTTLVLVVFDELCAGHPDFLWYVSVQLLISLLSIPKTAQPFLKWQYNQMLVQSEESKGE